MSKRTAKTLKIIRNMDTEKKSPSKSVRVNVKINTADKKDRIKKRKMVFC